MSSKGYASWPEEVPTRLTAEPEWLREGFESFEEFAEEWDRLPRGRTRSPHVRQVSITLRVHLYAELEQMGDERGLTPTTMARILVNSALVSARRDRQG